MEGVNESAHVEHRSLDRAPAMTLNRYQAFTGHLGLSAAVAAVSAALVFLVWYPSPLAAATGVTGIFLMLLAIDVIVGPVITLIVFNPSKKALKRDLLVVLVLQVAALLYGMNAVFAARPVYAVFNVDRFDLVLANDMTEAKLQKVEASRFKSLPGFGPQVIAARRPGTSKERNEILFGAAAGGDDLPQLPQYYVAYGDARTEAAKRAQPIDALRELNRSETARVDDLARRHAGRAAGVGYLPLRAKVVDMAVIVARDTGEVLEIADLRPWP